MTTLRAALIAARDRLRSEGIDEADFEAELLLRYALEVTTPAGGAPARPSSASGRAVTRAELYARFEDEMTLAVAAVFDSCVARRLEREPSAYIMGRREFRGLELCVAPAVLIPRPETEGLVDVALRKFARRHTDHGPPARPSRASGRAGHSVASPRIVDVGTGSGAIAVSLARELPGAEVCATDVSLPALVVAAGNARRHGAERRVALRRGHLLEPLDDYVDCIVANLPYVTTHDWATLEPEISDYEPRSALDGGQDGLDLIRGLLRQAPSYLRLGGFVALEIGERHTEALGRFVEGALPDATCRVERDFAGKDRYFIVEP